MPASGMEVYVGAAPMEPPPTGLLQAATVVDQADPRFVAGIRYDRPDVQALDTWDICSQDVANATALPAGGTGGVGNTGGEPTSSPSAAFALLQRDECSSYGWQARDYVGRAQSAFRVHESWALERIFGQNPAGIARIPYLSDASSPTLTYPAGSATLVDPARAIALADHAIAQANIGRGMIHLPAYLLDIVRARQVVDRDGTTRWLSPNGNIIVPGNGYTGKGPDGTGAVPTDGTAGVVWVYATELVTIHREQNLAPIPGTLAEAMVRDTNTIRYRVGRAYAIEWARLLHAAIRVPVQHTAIP